MRDYGQGQRRRESSRGEKRASARAQTNARGASSAGRGAGRPASRSGSARRGSSAGARRSASRATSRTAADTNRTAADVLRAIGRVLARVLRAIGRGLAALARAIVAFFQVAIPFCAAHLRATLAVVAAIAVAIAAAQVRGCVFREQAERAASQTLAASQSIAQSLASDVTTPASTMVEPTSTPRDQWKLGQMPYLYQIDPQWSHTEYSGGRLRHQGCGPTSLTMVYIALTGKTDKTPADMADFATQNGFATDGQGSSWSLMTDGAALLGLSGTQLSLNADTIKAELEAGRPVIFLMGPGTFTSSGHFIAVEGLDADGLAIVHDSNSWVRSQKNWDVSLICSEAITAWSFTAA